MTTEAAHRMQIAASVLTEEQRALREATTRFAQARYPLTTVRHVADSGDPLPKDFLLRVGELGWFAMLVPEALGGGTVSGRPTADAAVIADIRGRNLQPAAFVPTNVVAVALAEVGSEIQQAKTLPAIIAGETPVAWAYDDCADGGISYVYGDAGTIRLAGSVGVVQDGHSAELILICANGVDGPLQALVPRDGVGVSTERLVSFDVTRQFADVHLDDVELSAEDIVGSTGEASREQLQRQLDLAAVLTSAEMVGTMGRDLEMAIEYAKTRTAFGRPIGSFQALKHQLADAATLVEASKGVVDAAVDTRDAGATAEDISDAASVAKAFVSRSAVEVAHVCWQVFAGIAYTWEHDQHLYLRRLTTDAALYGDVAAHHRRLLTIHGVTDAR